MGAGHCIDMLHDATDNKMCITSKLRWFIMFWHTTSAIKVIYKYSAMVTLTSVNVGILILYTYVVRTY